LPDYLNVVFSTQPIAQSERWIQPHALPAAAFSKPAVGATALGLPQIVTPRVFGANDRLNMGHIGVDGMGGGHLDYMTGRMHGKADVNVAAVCDADEKHLAEALRRAGPQATAYRDYRALL
jgi:hypothetical protein